METQTQNATDQIVKQVVNSWQAQNKAVNNFLAKYDEAAYSKEVAPNRNRAIYLLGHLIAVNDALLPLLGLGDKLYPELFPFITESDKAIGNTPPFAEMKQKWENVCATLTNHFDTMTAEDWLSRHTSVSAEDFEKEPTRNKLNVLLSRTNHQSYHLGQMNLLNA